MLFAIFGLDFWSSVLLSMFLFIWMTTFWAKKAAGNPLVQRGVLHWIFGK